MDALTLFTTGCPKCIILKKKLEQKEIAYEENTNVDEMRQLGINEVPVLTVNGDLLSFKEANKWINSREG